MANLRKIIDQTTKQKTSEYLIEDEESEIKIGTRLMWLQTVESIDLIKYLKNEIENFDKAATNLAALENKESQIVKLLNKKSALEKVLNYVNTGKE